MTATPLTTATMSFAEIDTRRLGLDHRGSAARVPVSGTTAVTAGRVVDTITPVPHRRGAPACP
jgi:hypothetical protein